MLFRLLLCCLWFLGLPVLSTSQSTAFVPGAGLTLCTQRWDNSFDRDPLLKYHFVLGIESVNNEDDRSALLAQFGYHVKGSANRIRYFVPNGPNVVFKEEFLFRNLSLLLAAKQKFDIGGNRKLFYAGGVRGEYTLSTNLKDLVDNNPFLVTFYPQDAFVRRWIFGISVGGGVEWMFRDLVGVQLNVWVHPDATLQYNQPPIPNVINPNFPGTTTTIPERRIRNVALEATLGLRLLRKVEYID